MLFNAASALAALAMASQAIAAEITYGMSARELFGLARREDTGYQPTFKTCKNGLTCAEACGAGFVTCPSTDNAIHCYSTAKKDVCCSDGSGNSCDPGFYCASHATNGTLCCPEGKNTDECAKSYNLSGPLVSQVPAPTTYPTSTKSSHTMTYEPTATYPASNSTKKPPPPPSTTPSTVPTSAASVVGSGFALLVAIAAAAIL